jgi:hypothetical protein
MRFCINIGEGPYRNGGEVGGALAVGEEEEREDQRPRPCHTKSKTQTSPTRAELVRHAPLPGCRSLPGSGA